MSDENAVTPKAPAPVSAVGRWVWKWSRSWRWPFGKCVWVRSDNRRRG